MPGMGHGVDIHNPVVTNLFRLGLHVSFVWVLAFAVLFALGLAFVALRSPDGVPPLSEARPRTTLRVGFGLLWLLDGLLQLQAGMPLGLSSQVLAPTKEAAPTWWHGFIGTAVQIWNQHPLALAQAAVWIQIALAFGLLGSTRMASRVAGLLSAIWALLIWLVSGFGGLFGHGVSVLFGWPGAPLFYAIAGLALALRPEKFPHVYQAVVSKIVGLILILGAVLQALPGSHFWTTGNDNALNQMIQDMTSVPQPAWLAGIGHVGAGVVRAAGPGINMLIVVWLMAAGVGLWRITVSGFRWPASSLAVGAVIVWIVVQDTGLFGGVATDPNSMLPLALLGITLSPRLRTAAPFNVKLSAVARRAIGNAAVSLAGGALIVGTYLGATGIFASPETTLYRAYNGDVAAVEGTPAPDFTLTDQNGQPFSLSTHRAAHEVVVLSFIDPVCYEECPQIGHQLLDVVKNPPSGVKVTVVMVAANLQDHSKRQVEHFMEQYDLAGVSSLYFLNGTTHQLRDVFEQYGITVTTGGEHGMSIHSMVVYIINAAGEIRYIVEDDPAPGPAGRASTVQVLRDAIVTLR